MEYVKFKGSKKELELKLSKVLSNTESKNIISNLGKFIEFLDDDEYIKIHNSSPRMAPIISFGARSKHMTGGKAAPRYEYNLNINVKAITIATLALLFDINISYGALSAILGMTGFSTHAIVLLNELNGEKCLVLEALRNRRFKRHINKEVFSNCNTECINNHLNCRYKNEGICHIEKDYIEELLDNLCEKNVFTKIGNDYKYNF